MNKTFIVAEVGSTHGRDERAMLSLVETAKRVGADAVKLQWLSSAARLCERRRAPEYLDAYSLIEFPRHWLHVMQVAAHDLGLAFMCTAYLPEDLPVVLPLVARAKISSFEAADWEFIAAHAPYDKPVIISTGMMREAEVSALEGALLDSDIAQWDLLLCTSAYPAPVDQVNLGRIARDESGSMALFTGFSDHTLSTLTGAVAVGLGAKILEKHLRLDDCDPGNADYAVALSPGPFADYVNNVRLAEQMIGTGKDKVLTEAEQPFAKYRVRS